jgi:LPS-assembly protein
MADPRRPPRRRVAGPSGRAGALLAVLLGAAAPPPKIAPVSKSAPVTFNADNVQYDRQNGIVTATGHVEAWQNGHQLRADKVTFDRNTNVLAASGHVQIQEPDGEVSFATYVELTSNMRDGVLRDLRAILASNGKLAANGARRVGAKINELSRVAYSTCNVCLKHPDREPLWEIRARRATQDVDHKRIEYRNVWIDVLGVPVLYLPWFSNADPSVKRESGFLVPSIGTSTHIGTFASVPYYYVIGPASDITLIPTVGSLGDSQLEGIYRRSFNNGTVRADGSVAYDNGDAAGHLFANARFDYNDTWRYGANIAVASSEDYLRDFEIGNLLGNVLNTSAYIEGFGQGGYAKLSAASYQGVNSTVTNSELPYVLPRYQYDYFGLPDAWGGRLSLDSNDFNVIRTQGTNDEQLSLNAQWQRPGIGAWGDVWSLTARVESVAYNAFDLNQQPNYASIDNTNTVRIQPTLALKLSWPLLRAERSGASEVIEPIVQLLASPNAGSSTYAKVPNEDSLAPEFTDTELFSLNRFQGVDRQEGGLRVNLGLHGTWTTKAGVFDALIGQSYRLHADDTFPSYVGLGRHASDIVARATYTPTSWFNLTARTRLDQQNFNIHFAEAVASLGSQLLRVTGGYLYTPNTPYFLDAVPAQGNPNMPRSEAQLGVSSHFGQWRISGYATRNLEQSQMVYAGADGAWENECAIVELKFSRRYTTIDNDHGSTTVLVQITLKTVGEFGFKAL